MVRTGIIRDDFFRKRILHDRLLVILATVIILVLFYFWGKDYLVVAALVLLALFLIDLPRLIKKFRHHRELISWINQHRNAIILAYSTKVKYLEIIEKHIIPACSREIIIIKLDEHRLKGKIPRTVWFELTRRTRMPQLPVVIRFHNHSYQITQIKRYISEYMENKTDEATMLNTLKYLFLQDVHTG
jgi:hypothetical protein